MPARVPFCVGLLWVVSFAFCVALPMAVDSWGKPRQESQQQPLDPYDAYFLSAARVDTGAAGRICKEPASSPSLFAMATAAQRPSKHMSFVYSQFAADLNGGFLQYEAERAGRRVAEKLTVLIQQPLNNDPDVVRAAKKASESCDSGVQRACVDLGYAARKGLGVARNPQRADLLFRKACAAGEPEGCAYLALGYERNYPKEAADLYDKACFAGQGESPACERLAALHEQGRGVTKDFPLAAALYRRNCEQSGSDPCFCSGWQRLSQQGVQPADITSKFVPPPPTSEPAQSPRAEPAQPPPTN